MDESGQLDPPEDARGSMHTTMQTLGRVAIIGGSVLVAAANVCLFARRRRHARGAEGRDLSPRLRARARHSRRLGPRRDARGRSSAGATSRRLAARGFAAEQTEAMLDQHPARPPVNWWILGGGLAFVVVQPERRVWARCRRRRRSSSLASMAIVLFLMWKLVRELEPEARAHAGRHRDRHLRVPRAARAGRGLDLVDDRRPRLRPAVPRDAVADRQRAHAARHVPLPPLHGRSARSPTSSASSPSRARCSACRSSACTTACTSGPRRTPAAWWTRASSRSSTPRSSRRSARSR